MQYGEPASSRIDEETAAIGGLFRPEIEHGRDGAPHTAYFPKWIEFEKAGESGERWKSS